MTTILLGPNVLDGGIDKDIWFAMRSDGQRGSGTYYNPWDASDQKTFDAFLRAIPPNTNIHFFPSSKPYITLGYRGWQPKPGQRFIGSGMFQTTLKILHSIDHNNLFWIGQLEDHNDVSDGVEFLDLTIDCGYKDFPADLPKRCMGLLLRGNFCAIRRVRCINFGTNVETVHGECFPLRIHAGPQNIYNPIIESCIVEGGYLEAKNTGIHAIIVAGNHQTNACAFNAQVRNNTVINLPNIPIFDNQARWVNGLGIINCKGALIENNYTKNVQKAFFIDTGFIHNVKIANNNFSGCQAGIQMIIGKNLSWSGIVIDSNTIELSPCNFDSMSFGTYFVGGFGFGAKNTKNVYFRNNIVRIAEPITGKPLNWGATFDSIDGLLIEGNIFELPAERKIICKSASTGYDNRITRLFNNIDDKGNKVCIRENAIGYPVLMLENYIF